MIQIKCCNDNYGIKRNLNKQRTIIRRNKAAKSWQTVYVEQYKLNAVTTISVLNGIEINSEQFSAGTKRPRTGNVAEIVSAGNKRSWSNRPTIFSPGKEKRETERPANSMRRNGDQWDWDRFLKFTCSNISATPLWLVWIKSGGKPGAAGCPTHCRGCSAPKIIPDLLTSFLSGAAND